jgi:tetratricopeptide (TPR) repeat protein
LGRSFISDAQITEEKLLSFIEDGQHDTTRVRGYVELAKTYRIGTPEKAVFYIDRAERLIDKKLKEGAAHRNFYLNELTKVYNVSGVIYRNFGNYPEALRKYKKALKLLESVDNEMVLSSALFNVGLLNNVIGNPEEALGYLERSLEVRKKNKENLGRINCYREIGRAHFDMGNYTKAIENLDRSIDICYSSKNLQKVFKSHNYLAEVYMAIKRYDVLSDSLYNAMEILNQKPDAYAKEHYRISIPLARVLFAKGEVQKGLDIIDQSIAVTRKINSLSRLSKLYKAAAEGNSITANYAQANYWFNEKMLLDSVMDANSNTAEIARIEMNYLFNRQHEADSLKLINEAEISKLKLKQKSAAIEKSQLNITFLIVAIVLLSVLGFFIYRNYRLKRKALSLKEKDVENLSLKIKRESDWIDELVTLNDKIKKNQVDDTPQEIQKLVNTMRDNLVVDKHRQVQAKNIEVVSNEFRDKLKSRYPDLTKTELEMCELIRLELSNSEISRVRNISQNSARMARYRLKKKLNLEDDQTVFDVLKDV